MIKALLLGLLGIFISVLTISIVGIFLPKTNLQQFSSVTIFYVGLLGPIIEELVRASLALFLIKNPSLAKALIFGLSWAMLEEFFQLAQGTDFFRISTTSYYNAEVIISTIGTRMMHLVCAFLAISNWLSFKKRLSFLVLIHTAHNLLTIVLSQFDGFNYLEKSGKILVYTLLLVLLGRLLLKATPKQI
ncbi:MAG: hypothetical protein COC12_14040 [Rhodobacteraceae bacterium]|nr:MAG: hypothetical protein COC12_14040 [Paracoccaceae bacterium]